MAIILKPDDIIPPVADHPIDIIFVDTNVIINYEDPFSYVKSEKNEYTVSLLNQLKSVYKVRSTIAGAVEFYKYLQVGFYNIYVQTHSGDYEKYSTIAFKKLKIRDTDFSEDWKLRLKVFNRTFKRHFPAFDLDDDSIYNEELLNSFDGTKVDFADEIIYKYSTKINNSTILTEDKDFESYPDDVRIITP